jgi:hypothetical protein
MLPIAAGNIRRGPTAVISNGLRAGKTALTPSSKNPRANSATGQHRLLSLADNHRSLPKEAPSSKERGYENKPRERKSLFDGGTHQQKPKFNFSASQSPEKKVNQIQQKVKHNENNPPKPLGVAKTKVQAPVVEIQKEIQALNQIASNLSPASLFSAEDYDSAEEQDTFFIARRHW